MGRVEMKIEFERCGSVLCTNVRCLIVARLLSVRIPLGDCGPTPADLILLDQWRIFLHSYLTLPMHEYPAVYDETSRGLGLLSRVVRLSVPIPACMYSCAELLCSGCYALCCSPNGEEMRGF